MSYFWDLVSTRGAPGCLPVRWVTSTVLWWSFTKLNRFKETLNLYSLIPFQSGPKGDELYNRKVLVTTNSPLKVSHFTFYKSFVVRVRTRLGRVTVSTDTMVWPYLPTVRSTMGKSTSPEPLETPSYPVTDRQSGVSSLSDQIVGYVWSATGGRERILTPVQRPYFLSQNHIPPGSRSGPAVSLPFRPASPLWSTSWTS